MLQQGSRNANAIYHLISNGSAFATRDGYGDAKKRMTIHDCDDVPTEMNDENSGKNDTTYCN
jgi:hypothetical protein